MHEGKHDNLPEHIIYLKGFCGHNTDRIITISRKGFTVVMTTSLASDVPVGYFSWAEYDIMAPPKNKTQNVLAAAFISNCGGHNFRLQAITKLREYGVSVDSYGACLRNKEGHGEHSHSSMLCI